MSMGKAVVAAGFILLLVVAVGILDTPPEENREAVTAASYAAAQAYEREMSRHGDELAARWASKQTFEEVLEQWERKKKRGAPGSRRVRPEAERTDRSPRRGRRPACAVGGA